MSIQARIYHNPRCSKSRATLALLEAHGVEPEVVNYLDTPPDAEALAALLAKLGKSAREILRFGEGRAAELGIARDDRRSEAEWIALMAANPTLIERPIVEIGERAVLGRPPENVLALIGQ